VILLADRASRAANTRAQNDLGPFCFLVAFPIPAVIVPDSQGRTRSPAKEVHVISHRLDQGDLLRLADVLAQPDPPELPRRGARPTHAGEPTRRQTVLLPLLIRWAQHRCLSPEPELAVPRQQTVTADSITRTA
jgi:hypothetical protein